MTITKIPTERIESSNLDRIGYDLSTHTLAIEFKSGHVHHYDDVPASLVVDLADAISKGRFYAQNIKGKFTSQKMTATCSACGDIGWIGDRCEDCGTRNYGTAAECGCDPGVSHKCAEHGGDNVFREA